MEGGSVALDTAAESTEVLLLNSGNRVRDVRRVSQLRRSRGILRTPLTP